MTLQKPKCCQMNYVIAVLYGGCKNIGLKNISADFKYFNTRIF